MKKLSAFDLGMIIAFAVIALLGGAGWWYLSGQLKNTQADVENAFSDFQRYSSKEVFLPTAANEKTLKDDIAVMHAQIDPLVKAKLQAPGNKLAAAKEESPVDWKHDLDAEVSRLNSAAKLHGVTVPVNFYYGFSRYLNQNPRDEQTTILSKQLYGVEELANIFIDAPVKAIETFRRTYEEDAEGSLPGANSSGRTDTDLLPGRAASAPGDIYTAYPFEIEFDATTTSFRKVVAALQNSPYVFVLRTVSIQNSNPTSPLVADLDKMAGPDNSSPTDTSPGAVSEAKSSKGPMFLFGNETLHIKARIDLIEWKGVSTDAASAGAARAGGARGRGERGSSRGEDQ